MLTRNAVMIVPAVLCAFRLWADTVEVSNDTEIESLPADVATLEYTGAGLLTITGARPIDSTTTTSVTFNCPVRFTAEEATLVLRNGQINFAKPVSFVQLRSEAKKISIQGTATVSGTKLDIIGLDTLNSDITTTSLVVENGTDELPNRFAGLGELRTKGPAKVRFTGAGSSAANTTDRIAKWTFGQWNTQIALEANMTLTIGTASAEPGGFMSRSVASGCFLKSEEPMANGIWKPFTDVTSGGYLSSLDSNGTVVNATPSAYLPYSGSDPATVYQQSGSTVQLAETMEISAYRATGWVNIDLNGHDLVIGSGILAVGVQNKDIKVYDTAVEGGGRLVFGGQDIFCNFQNSRPVISAPMAWRRPAGNTSVGPSLFILGDHWYSFQFLGDDQINDYNIVYVGNDNNQETVFGGSGDRTIHGALVGTSPIRKEGTGTFRIAGAHYPLNSNSINVNAGRVVFEKSTSRYYTVNVKSGATLEVGEQFDAIIGSLTLNDGSTLAGSGKITTSIRNLESNRWLSPGSTTALGTLKISAEGNDAHFYFKSGAGFKIKVSETESDCVDLCASWNYLDMPASGGTFNLELSPVADGLSFSPSREYKIFCRSGSQADRVANKTAFAWNITTTHPKQLDVSQAKVEYKNNAYWLSGVKTPHPGLCIFVR